MAYFQRNEKPRSSPDPELRKYASNITQLHEGHVGFNSISKMGIRILSRPLCQLQHHPPRSRQPKHLPPPRDFGTSSQLFLKLYFFSILLSFMYLYSPSRPYSTILAIFLRLTSSYLRLDLETKTVRYQAAASLQT